MWVAFDLFLIVPFNHPSFLMNLTGHIGVLCYTKWSGWCCQSPYRQLDYPFMCNSSLRV